MNTFHQGELRYQAILEDQTELICRFKADATTLYVNDAFCRLFGKSREELVGQKWKPVVVPEDLPALEDKLSTITHRVSLLGCLLTAHRHSIDQIPSSTRAKVFLATTWLW
jgi:PAS domain-containing protein